MYLLYFHLCWNSFEVYEMTVPIWTSHWCLVMNSQRLNISMVIHIVPHTILQCYMSMSVTTIYFGGDVWKNTNLSPPIIGLLYCNMWHMICPPFMNPGYSLVDLLLFPIHFQFRKNKTVWPPPLDCTLGWARKCRLAASFEKNSQFDCHWCLNEMKVGAKRKKQDEQADIRLFFRR